MYKEFYEFLKEDHIRRVRELEINDSSDLHTYVSEQAKVIEMMRKLNEYHMKYDLSLTKNENKVNTTTQRIKQDEVIDSKKDKEISSTSKITEKNSKHRENKIGLNKKYRFQRELLGGSVPELNLMITEETVRERHLEHDDWIIVYKHKEKGKEEIACLLEEEGPKSSREGRIQFNKCIVEESATRLICQKNGKGYLKVNGELYCTLISEEDARKFNLKPKDIIDIALYQDSLNRPTVIWKHENIKLVGTREQSTNEENSIKEEKSNHINNEENSIKEDKSNDITNENMTPVIPQTLKDKKILIVSYEHERNKYNKEITKRGGKLLMGDAKYSVQRLHNAVKKADIVIFVTTNTSHNAVEAVKIYAKAIGIPFIESKRGVNYVIRSVEEKFKMKIN